MEQAYKNVREDLLIILRGGAPLADRIGQLHAKVEDASPGYFTLIAANEETTQMVESVPGMEYGEERYRIIQLGLAFLATGILLAEYCRLTSEDA